MYFNGLFDNNYLRAFAFGIVPWWDISYLLVQKQFTTLTKYLDSLPYCIPNPKASGRSIPSTKPTLSNKRSWQQNYIRIENSRLDEPNG